MQHGVRLGPDGTPRDAWRSDHHHPWRDSEKEARLDAAGNGTCRHPYEALRRRTPNARVLTCTLCEETLTAAPVLEVIDG